MTMPPLPQPECPVCAQSENRLLCKSGEYDIFCCDVCECDFVWPAPDQATLKAYYDGETYFCSDENGSYVDYDTDTVPVLALFRDYLCNLPSGAGKKILDIGCAFGTHLAIAAELGWEAWGVELSAHARETALARHGEHIRVVEKVSDLPNIQFDLVVMLDVLEHLTNPYEPFKELFRRGLIGPDTTLVITTPNARSTDAMVDPANWIYRYPPAHLVYFSSRSLRLFCNNLDGNEVAIRGIYSIAESEVVVDALQYHQLAEYAGLMAEVRGFRVFPGNWPNFGKEAPVDDAQQILLELRTSYRKIRQRLVLQEMRLSETIVSRDAAINELQQLTQTRWHRLGNALRARPMIWRRIANISCLMAARFTLGSLRRKLSFAPHGHLDPNGQNHIDNQ